METNKYIAGIFQFEVTQIPLKVAGRFKCAQCINPVDFATGCIVSQHDVKCPRVAAATIFTIVESNVGWINQFWCQDCYFLIQFITTDEFGVTASVTVKVPEFSINTSPAVTVEFIPTAEVFVNRITGNSYTIGCGVNKVQTNIGFKFQISFNDTRQSGRIKSQIKFRRTIGWNQVRVFQGCCQTFIGNNIFNHEIFSSRIADSEFQGIGFTQQVTEIKFSRINIGECHGRYNSVRFYYFQAIGRYSIVGYNFDN